MLGVLAGYSVDVKQMKQFLRCLEAVDGKWVRKCSLATTALTIPFLAEAFVEAVVRLEADAQEGRTGHIFQFLGREKSGKGLFEF